MEGAPKYALKNAFVNTEAVMVNVESLIDINNDGFS